tara:strand:+ start:906 stop:1166 length:261 start_codon:yes stop_codon:yes gene_type:complete
MSHNKVKLGDLVSLYFSDNHQNIKLGMVTALKKDNFIVKWIWYDKIFFMDSEHDMFNDLNQQYLLTETLYNREDLGTCLKLVSYDY